VALTPEERLELIQRYADGPRLLREALEQVPNEARRWRPSPGKWSVHEVICHCADSETNAAMRIRYVLAERSPTIIGYDQEAWARALEYGTHPIEPAVAAVDAARANTVPLLRRLPEEAWTRQGTHTESGKYSAEDWLRLYAEHLEVHARQIQRNLAAWQAKDSA
jgi:hypothetical protein